MKKKLLAILLVLIMVVGMVPTVTFADGSEAVYLAFTSDVHNGSGGGNVASKRLDNWLDGVATHLGEIIFDAMGFCGDNGSSTAYDETYWSYVQDVMDVVDDNDYVDEAYFTAGNHEYINGKLSTTASNETAKKIIVNDEAVETDSYSIYCLGASQQKEEYTIDNIEELEGYLKSKEDSNKPIFILTHFPLHTYGVRTTENAKEVIELLNDYPNVVFLWGHNHSQSDKNYDKIFTSGNELTYAPGETMDINFTYCAAGCMSDSEYMGSQSVKGKGLIAKIMDGNIEFTYYDLSYANADSEHDDPVIPSVVPEDGKQYVIVADNGYALTTTQGDGYSNNGSGRQKYNYKGLEGIEYISGMETTDDMLWTFTASEGGYNISNCGKYLNGEYEQNETGGYDGTLALDDEVDVWTLSGNMLKSKNASTGQSDKFLTHSNVDAFENLFSVRSQNNASTLKFYKVEDGDIENPDDPETTNHEIDVTASSSGASASKTIKVGDTLTINLKNGSSYNAKSFLIKNLAKVNASCYYIVCCTNQ